MPKPGRGESRACSRSALPGLPSPAHASTSRRRATAHGPCSGGRPCRMRQLLALDARGSAAGRKQRRCGRGDAGPRPAPTRRRPRARAPRRPAAARSRCGRRSRRCAASCPRRARAQGRRPARARASQPRSAGRPRRSRSCAPRCRAPRSSPAPAAGTPCPRLRGPNPVGRGAGEQSPVHTHRTRILRRLAVAYLQSAQVHCGAFNTETRSLGGGAEGARPHAHAGQRSGRAVWAPEMMRPAPGVAGARPWARAHRRQRPASGSPRSAPPACSPSAACPPRSLNLTLTLNHNIPTLPCSGARAHRRQRPASGWRRSAPPACCRSAACPPQTRASGPRSPPGPPAAPGDRAAQSAHTREVTHAMAASS